jgi:transposase
VSFPSWTYQIENVVVEAPAPSRPIERGLAGPGLLAHVLGKRPVFPSGIGPG